MLFVSDMPHLKLIKQKVYLPIDEKTPSMYSMVFVNGLTTEAVHELFNNPLLSTNRKYHHYYLESHYVGKLYGKTYRINELSQRNDTYSQVEKRERGLIKGVKTASSIANKNVIVDWYRYNEIFFLKAKKMSTIKTIALGYVDYLKEMINDTRFTSYKHRVVVTNLDEWMKNTDSHSISKNSVNLIFYLLLRQPDKFKELGDIDFVFYTGDSKIRLNPSLCDKNTYRLFKTQMARISKLVQFDETEKDVDKKAEAEELRMKIASEFIKSYNLTGEGENDEKLEEKIKSRVEELENSESVKSYEGKELEDKLKEAVDRDEKLAKEVFKAVQEKKTGKSTYSSKRDEELRNKQKELKIDNMTIEDFQAASDLSKITLESINVTDKVKTSNKNVTTVKFPSFEKTYNQHLLKRDMMNNILFMNDKSIPVFVRNMKVEDSSNELNLKETYTFELEDGNRLRHTLKFDMPKFIDDKFMYLNGNKKIINKQLYMKPIVKTGPDEVQICSSYNKVFIRRYGRKVSAKIEKFKKALTQNQIKGVTVKMGNNLATNNEFKSTIEYDEISKDITSIHFNSIEFYFNQAEVKKLVEKRGLKIPEDSMCVGFIDPKTPILVSYDTQMIGGMDIIDYIFSISEGKMINEFEQATAGKKFVYTRATVMSRDVPVVLLLGYVEGLSSVLRKAKIKHYFTDTRPKVDITQGVVQFSNGYLVFERMPFENSLLMNAFADIPTKAFTIEDFEEKDAYLTIFDSMFGVRNIGRAFDNFYEFMIDPITKEVLEDLNFPTDFVSVFLYAQSLLVDNAYLPENNMSLYRVRSNELVNAFLYRELATAYATYHDSASNNNPKKISIRKDAIIKRLLMAQTVEDYSILNPIVELEKSRAISPKGHSGMNLSQAYTQDKRSYDETMMGLLSMSTSPDANCGVVRQLTLEPNITGPRGYIDMKHDKLDELTDANLFSPAELLSPLGVTRDDSIRTAMATKQSKHIIPIEKSSPVLISNGTEQIMHYHLSDDFSIVAKYDGKVVEVNEDTGLIIVEYTDKNGIPQEDGGTKTVSYKAIDIKPKVVKNGAGGFFLSNQLSSDLKVGQTFKKNDIIASDKKFFTNSKIDGNRFNIGSLQKVAAMSTYATYEDSTLITNKLAKDMTSDIVMQKTVTIGKNANIDHIVKIGDEIVVGDELIRFEESFDDDSLNKMLASIGGELREEINSLGKTPIKSKYSGVIEDIKIYSTVDLDDMSPSLRKIVSSYYNQIDKKHKQLDKYDKSESMYKCGVLLNEPARKIETKDGKVKGQEVGEGVLIEFYIKYRDVMGVGDKITFFTALKSIIGEVVPEGLEPFSEYRPDEEISSVIAPGAILARMTPSILLTMFGNKVLVELKRELEDIYKGKK